LGLREKNSHTLSYRGPIDNVNVQLKFFHQAQFAGMYVAQEQGMYKKNGINVTFIPYSGSVQPVDVLKSGDAQFAVMGADEVIEARAMGVPIKAVAVIYKVSPVAAYTLKTSGITKPQDFIGKKVGLAPLKNIQMMYAIAMNRIGVNREKIQEVPMRYDATELLNGSLDVSTGFSINEPYQVIKAGKEPVVFLLADYGASFYNDVIVTTDELIRTNPSLVERFVQATLQGWVLAIERPDEAVSATLMYAKDKDKESQYYMLNNSIPLIRIRDKEIGWMIPEQWQKLLEAMSSSIQTPLRIDDLYTNVFVEKAY